MNSERNTPPSCLRPRAIYPYRGPQALSRHVSTVTEQPVPVIVFVHGGGWALGSIDTPRRFDAPGSPVRATVRCSASTTVSHRNIRFPRRSMMFSIPSVSLLMAASVQITFAAASRLQEIPQAPILRLELSSRSECESGRVVLRLLCPGLRERQL